MKLHVDNNLGNIEIMYSLEFAHCIFFQLKLTPYLHVFEQYKSSKN